MWIEKKNNVSKRVSCFRKSAGFNVFVPISITNTLQNASLRGDAIWPRGVLTTWCVIVRDRLDSKVRQKKKDSTEKSVESVCC